MHFEDFEALQRTRESCRVYSDKPVSRELLTHLVEVAGLSPSACNSQPWRFIVVDDPEVKGRMEEVLDDRGVCGCPWADRVPAFIVICEETAHLKPAVEAQYRSQHFAQMDIGMAAMSLCCEASSLGLGTCMLGTINQEKARQLLNVPEHCPARLVIAVGYPALSDAPRRKTRKSLDEIISYNQWQA